jgi:hypothetical protein
MGLPFHPLARRRVEAAGAILQYFSDLAGTSSGLLRFFLRERLLRFWSYRLGCNSRHFRKASVLDDSFAPDRF